MVIWKLSGELTGFGFCGRNGKLKCRVKCKGAEGFRDNGVLYLGLS